MRYSKSLLLVTFLVVACASIFVIWTSPGVLAIESPRPGASSSKNWKFRIRVPKTDAPLMASLSLDSHVPIHLDSGEHTYSINTETTVLVPISSGMSSVVGSIDLEPSSNPDGIAKSSRITLKLLDAKGEVLGFESIAVDGCCGDFGFMNRHSKLLSLRKVNLVNLRLRDDSVQNDFDVSFQFVENRK